MAITAISIGQTWEFISKYDPDRENPTVFVLQVLPARVLAHLQDEATVFEVGDNPNERATKLRLNATDYEIVRFGLADIRNLRDEHGQEIKFSTERVNRWGKSYTVASHQILDRLPQVVIKELAEEILQKNTLSEGERKNSDLQSSPAD